MGQTDILLESGTNELEILEFKVGDCTYGINVAKIIEISTERETIPVPNAADFANEIFVLRGEVISVIDLFKVLKAEPEENERKMFITCSFNKIMAAFRVGKVASIHRVSWTDIKKPPRLSNSGQNDDSGILTGIVEIKDPENEDSSKLILILDFEKIVSKISKTESIDARNVDKFKEINTVADKKILVADDSAFLNKMIVSSLNAAGFENVVSFQDGKEAWDYLVANDGANVACVVSDIEMPQMDGIALTKTIKEDSRFKHIPVLLFSSLINEQMALKCKSVGADGQFSKPDIHTLIQALLKILEVGEQ